MPKVNCLQCGVGIVDNDSWTLAGYGELHYFCCSDCLLEFAEEAVVTDHMFDEEENEIRD